MDLPQPPSEEPSAEAVAEAMRTADGLRDSGALSEAADAYARVVTLDPGHVGARVQLGNMLKDCGRFAEAEIAYRVALKREPGNADTHLQLGHLLKIQGRRAEAVAAYRRSGELDPSSPWPLQELAALGDPGAQGGLFELHQRLGTMAALSDLTQRLVALREEIDRIAAVLPDIRTQLAFPIACYDRFRELHGVPPPPPAKPQRFSIILSGDREPLATLHAQIVAITRQTHREWVLRVVGRDAAHRRAVEQIAVADPRIGWVEANGADGEAVAERRAAGACGADWLLLLGHRALLDPRALAWFCAAAEHGSASAYVCDEEVATRGGHRTRFSGPQFRQVVDYDTLLETNPYGDTIAVTHEAYCAIADTLATGSIAAARSALLLGLAHRGQVGHVPCTLVATDRAPDAIPRERSAAHRDAVEAHLAAVGAAARITIGAAADANGRLAVRWRPNKPDAPITVIVPTRDNGADVDRFADSLRATASAPGALRLLIIDNGSREERTSRILARLGAAPDTQILRLDEPFNWSHLNNRAAAEADTPLIVFANDDMEMLSREWDAILRGLLERPEIGAVGARLLYPDDTIQSGGMLFDGSGMPIHDGRYERRDEPGPLFRLQVTRATAATTGAFLAMRRTVFLDHGGFDAIGMPVSYSDVDFALKLRAAGLRLLWTPDITAYHAESKSRGLDHLDAEKLARQTAEHAVLRERWGELFDSDPSLNPVWHMATLPFRLIAPPSSARLLAHLARCASSNPWLPQTKRAPLGPAP